MPVSGIVITCTDGRTEEIAVAIDGRSGLEVHGVLPENRIVAVIEADSIDDEVTLVKDLHEIDGIVTVRMAYHNFEDLEAEQPE
jgi:nitrate reductase NapD